MEQAEILNVTLIEPRLKHPTIFDKFDSLDSGQSLTILNDHDPKPLYYQMLAERGNTFSWDYIESGPEFWKVKITKKVFAETPETVGEIVAKDYRKAQVFKKLGIDFCCGGKKALTEVCKKKGLDMQKVKAELAAVEEQDETRHTNFSAWDPDFLCDYIVNTHHRYVRENIPFLSELSQKVARVHGDSHPELLKIATVFATVVTDLNNHFQKEENILFPYIKELVFAKKSGTPLHQPHFGSVANPIQVMEMEHENAGEDLSEIRELSDNYSIPEGACSSYRILYKKLEEFETDLHQHVHLENNILFPKAVELEKELK